MVTVGTRPLRFCFVTTFYPPFHFGGDAIFVHRLAEALAARGHRVDVLHSIDAYRVKAGADPDLHFVHHSNVRRFPLESGTPRLSALSVQQLGRPAAYGTALATHFAEHAYDVIHYHNASLMGAPAVMRLGNAVKFYTTHEYWLVCPTHVLFKYDREACMSRECIRCTIRAGRPPQLWRYTGLLDDCIGELDALLMPSQFALERHRKDGITGNMVVLPLFVPMPGDDTVDSHTMDNGTIKNTIDNTEPPSRPYFLFVGRLEKLKGVQDLLTLFATYRDADFLIVGTGAYEDTLRAQARDLPHVRFTGAMHPSELSRYYRGATAVLVPSLCFEVFPLICAEAMAHGTPVIGRRIGAVEEGIEMSGGGLTFNTMSECRDAMTRLLSDSALRSALGERGRAYAQRTWTEEEHLTHYLALVAEHMERRAVRDATPDSHKSEAR